MAVITTEEAIRHLRIDEIESKDVDFLADLELKIEVVSELCLRYLNKTPDAYLDSSLEPVGVPFYLKAAALIWLGILFKDRDGQEQVTAYGQIPVAVSNLLVQYRKPPIAY